MSHFDYTWESHQTFQPSKTFISVHDNKAGVRISWSCEEICGVLIQPTNYGLLRLPVSQPMLIVLIIFVQLRVRNKLCFSDMPIL